MCPRPKWSPSDANILTCGTSDGDTVSTSTCSYKPGNSNEKSKCMSLIFKNILPTIDLDVKWFWSDGHTVTSLKKMMSCKLTSCPFCSPSSPRHYTSMALHAFLYRLCPDWMKQAGKRENVFSLVQHEQQEEEEEEGRHGLLTKHSDSDYSWNI